MAFIIGSYDKWDRWDKEHSVHKFMINGNWYAIKMVEMEWGIPNLNMQVEGEDAPESYYIYETYEEALEYVEQLKKVNGGR